MRRTARREERELQCNRSCRSKSCDEEYLQRARNDFRPAGVFHTLPSRKPHTGCTHGPATGPEHQREGRR
ncbi:hypothetical protein GGD63_004806 [Bradyrhizobium sp. cir1]|nr:hypothetical protein [Bradyrhizobium sp. cir1]